MVFLENVFPHLIDESGTSPPLMDLSLGVKARPHHLQQPWYFLGKLFRKTLSTACCVSTVRSPPSLLPVSFCHTLFLTKKAFQLLRHKTASCRQY